MLLIQPIRCSQNTALRLSEIVHSVRSTLMTPFSHCTCLYSLTLCHCASVHALCVCVCVCARTCACLTHCASYGLHCVKTHAPPPPPPPQTPTLWTCIYLPGNFCMSMISYYSFSHVTNSLSLSQKEQNPTNFTLHNQSLPEQSTSVNGEPRILLPWSSGLVPVLRFHSCSLFPLVPIPNRPSSLSVC